MTEQTYDASTSGPVNVYVTSHMGQVRVITDQRITKAAIEISTAASEGRIAQAVEDATIRQNGDQIEVRVPKVQGAFGGSGSTTMIVGGSSFTFSGSGAGVQMIGGDIFMGGQQIVSNGRVVAAEGTVVGGAGGTGEIVVTLRLPEMSSAKVTTTSADVSTAGGILQVLDVDSQSGDVQAETVRELRVKTMSGDVEATRVDCEVNVGTMSGDIEIGAYNGSRFWANTMSGDIDASASPAATGRMDLKSMSGDVSTRGAGHLNPSCSTMSGRVRNR
ncbi:DUF4097 family beta strand repeat-containing protein (plasmid) [Streptomyces xanthophaeus]|uniref:DUF4097 family beta strand repeat-containing protein n=1 Tax=Streptomyces xanthophaeus TaxID=67385 RepID=UPI00386544D7|nr:DUF4097 family beta strand repeat-containing protein [Streptomyces xanthophaeus]WST27643.1 DUF4097 family beta strand repeat-containing protein [Streptomyces xanthophaeus]WST65989.1 DUF4097 family beta strand repeat-containing protein [Streptomyces xanthophaeus]WST66017.1 DUF4097 family beta strand repeat-containing protein [Streptomyces xanthophaeus]